MGIWFTKAGMLRHFSVRAAPCAHTSQATRCLSHSRTPAESYLKNVCQATRMFRARKAKSGRALTPSIKRLSGLKPCRRTVATALART